MYHHQPDKSMVPFGGFVATSSIDSSTMSSDSLSSNGYNSPAPTEIMDDDFEGSVPASPAEAEDVPNAPLEETFDFTFAAPDNRMLRSALPQWIGGNRVTRPQLIKDCAEAIKQARKNSTEAEPLSKLEAKHLKAVS
jgi:hypothetical protein